MSRRITLSEWNGFVASQSHSEFTQSWEWGESAYVREQLEILRIAFPEEGPVRAVCQLIEQGQGTQFHYWFSPGGPIGLSSDDAAEVLKKVTSELKLHSVPFVRIEPSSTIADTKGMRRVLDGRPSTTRILDLSQGAESLFRAMHEKTRYNIRLAIKKGVTVRELYDVQEYHPGAELFEKSMKTLHVLLRETANRGGFSLHPWPHYVHLIDAFVRKDSSTQLNPEHPTLRFYTAWHEDTMIAAILCMAFGDTVSYLHGASSNAHRSLMAPFALQWHAMREAMEAKYRYYDLWGVAPEGAPDTHPWAGFSRFKQGFGGEVVEYPGTFDIPLRPFQYKLYSVARMMYRRFRRPIQ